MPEKQPNLGRDDPASPMEKSHRKSDRTHEENQERAYIAASRRADRSTEARLQSAKMASEIHKKRTGKGFRITEEIVMKEEMYEEEEDDLPRSFRLLGPHMKTESPELNARLEAYLSNRMAMSALIARTNEEWRENEINRLFAQSFPNVGRQAQHAQHAQHALHAQHAQHAQQLSRGMPGPIYSPQQLSQGMPGPIYNTQLQIPVEMPVIQSITYIPRSKRKDRTRSRTSSRSSAASRRGSVVSSAAPTPGSNRDTPALTRATTSAMAAGTPSFDGGMTAGTPMDFGSSPSAFTAELPPEARMLLGGMMGMSGGYGQAMYGQQYSNPTQYYNPSEAPDPVKPEEPHDATRLGGEYVSDDSTSPMKWDPSSQNVTEESWNTFINDAAWRHDQQ
ncbi:Uncharacterized protein TPAR_06428 [Tolypocladium paradoxum]|uniref:Uncharacterized protein n=1 Tax=Tolypocladium paradoxum TaxID=94208 RepID=A0A2S4KT77_9HYPO|nr:Uncharacterized protein TPAR_06428 [Tolypocladium paradoxum]